MNLKILILTGNQPRHIYFAEQILKNFNVKSILIEEKGSLKIPIPRKIKKQDKANHVRYFEERFKTEKKYFGKSKIEKNTIFFKFKKNRYDKKLIRHIKNLDINFVVVFGTSIIPKKILKLLPKEIINLHLGFIQKYRGSAPLFWPFIFFEPHNVGGTFHYVAPRVDSGNIIHQYKTNISSKDKIHDVSCKAVIDAGKHIVKLLKFRKKKKFKSLKQKKLAKNFKNSDFKPELLRIIYQLQKNKICKEYSKINKNISNIKLFKQY